MPTAKISLNELKKLVRVVIKEESEEPKQKIKIGGEILSVYLINNPFDSYVYILDSEGELYIDISTNLPDNQLDRAIWVEVGGKEEKIADNLKFLQKTSATSKSGYNTYVKYDIV